MSKLIALVSSQGTACSETVLTEAEDTPTNRARVEAMFCNGQPDDPQPGTWVDVTDNEACASLLDDDQ